MSASMRIVGVSLYFLPVRTRVPYQFGAETMTEVVCARVCLRARGDDGTTADGWGETPLSVQWVWPGALSYAQREAALLDFTTRLVEAWSKCGLCGHPLKIGNAFITEELPRLLSRRNEGCDDNSAMPWLAALVCCSPFDLALYDAYGKLTGRPVYETLDGQWLQHDLSAYLEPDEASTVSFAGRYPADFLRTRRDVLPVWHSVGGLDPLTEKDLTGAEPDDGYPTVLRDWIVRDGLKCLKVKLRGHDAEWDRRRLTEIGAIARETDVRWLCADYNCTATSVDYVTDMLDALLLDDPGLYGMLLYVEQPFPYDLEAHPFDVHAIAARKPLFMDESAHDWQAIRHGRKLGWNNVALKTCKTQTGALLSLCWARAHGMTIMVQDLTNPMLAFVTHALLAAHAGTVMGLECNSAQYYPDASLPEAAVHPGLFARRNGQIDLSSIHGPGFGYRLEEIRRELPSPAVSLGMDGLA